MCTIYMYILQRDNNIYGLVSDKIHSDLSNITVVGLSTLTSYIPIQPSDVCNFAMDLTKNIKEAFSNTSVDKSGIYYVNISKKRAKVFTWVDLDPDVPHPYDIIGKVVLELPLLEWELLFDILEKVKDFFQENLPIKEVKKM